MYGGYKESVQKEETEKLKRQIRSQNPVVIAQKVKLYNLGKDFEKQPGDLLEYFDYLDIEEKLHNWLMSGKINPSTIDIEVQRSQWIRERTHEKRLEQEYIERRKQQIKEEKEQEKKEDYQLNKVRKQLGSNETTLDLRPFHPLEQKVFTQLFTELPIHKREIILDINQLRPFPVNELSKLGKQMPHVLSITVEGDLNEQEKTKVSAFKAVVDSLAPKHFNQVNQVLNKQVKGEIKGEFNEELKKIIHPKQSRPHSLISEYVFGHYPFFGSEPKPAIQDEGCAVHCACTIS